MPDPAAAQNAAPPAEISVTTWNLGYAGLGAESDFMADGGKMLRVPTREAAEANAAAIAARLAAADSDVVFLQEVSEPAYPNRKTNLLGALRGARPEENFWFTPTTRVRGPFELSAAKMGLAMVSAHDLSDSGTLRLESPFTLTFWFASRTYRAQAARIPAQTGGGWTLINLHLSAFDDDASLRLRQLSEVLEYAQAEYAAGQHVVIGGDFNLELAETGFAHTTGEKDLFWLHALPEDAAPAGWTVAADPTIPSVRTNEKPYVRGENYTTVIDGFIVSPNVEAVEVRGEDLDFRHADHQPVTARFRARQP